MGNLAGHQAERAMGHRDLSLPLMGVRIIDQLVKYHLAGVAQREGGAVGEDQTDGSVARGVDHVALEHHVAFLEGGAGAIGMPGGNRASHLVHHANLWAAAGWRSLRLGILAGSQRSSQPSNQSPLDQGAGIADQWRWSVVGEIVHDDDGTAIWANQDEVGPLAEEF
ncbi:hypothetical protein WV31_18950 [Magnetospirillum sp. ME-1]|nr:hypothetical protein WV31_18950 [Magnetospirillum sp. ME-1]